MTPAPRRIVLVSGAPATGKTTLAGPLAAALGFPLLAKDHIKETLHDALDGGGEGENEGGDGHGGAPGDALAGRVRVLGSAPADALAASRLLGSASMKLLWALAARCPEAVLEANFHPDHPDTRTGLDALAATVVEVHCHCPAEESVRRYRERAPRLHPVHVFREIPPEVIALSDRPIGYGPVIRVDTTRPTDLTALVAEIRRAFGGLGAP